ncbi:hypothetical protein AB0D04_09770 [Streptomyces sp. NPDC048483]|uniref:hypothetical protein n=1 Tax=Streptomyces sp. NPDC048483 TaxID=3154927 RepID=UPI003425A7E3
MSQPYPPSPQQPQQPQYGAPQPQYGAPGPGGFPPSAQPAGTGNPGGAIAVGFVVMLIVAAIYGGILNATDGATIGYAAVALGALIGAAMGKIGGRNAVVPVVAAILGLLAYYLGVMFSAVFFIGDVGVFFDHFGDINQAWVDNFEPIEVLFFVLAAAGGFSTAKKLGG